MPPQFSLINLVSSGSSSCDTSPYQEKAPRSFLDFPEMQLVNHNDNDVVDSNSSNKNAVISLKPTSNKHPTQNLTKSRKEIDLEAVKAKLRKIGSNDPMDSQLQLALANDESIETITDIQDVTPKSISIEPSPKTVKEINLNQLSLGKDVITPTMDPSPTTTIDNNRDTPSNLVTPIDNADLDSYRRQRTLSNGSDKTNDDTEIDDVSSSRSNSIPTVTEIKPSSSIVITIDPPIQEQTENETENENEVEIGATQSLLTVPVAGSVPEAAAETDDDEKVIIMSIPEDESVGALTLPVVATQKFQTEIEKNDVKIDFDAINESDQDATSAAMSSDDGIYTTGPSATSGSAAGSGSGSSTASESGSGSESESESESDLEEARKSLKHIVKKKHLKNISLDTTDTGSKRGFSQRDIFTDFDYKDMMIGKITTPTFKKKQEIMAKEEKRAQTDIAGGHINFFGYMNNDGEFDLAALGLGKITTPRFSQKNLQKVQMLSHYNYHHRYPPQQMVRIMQQLSI